MDKLTQETLLGPTEPNNVPTQKKDNRIKAIIWMNIFTLCATIVNILFKYISRYGVSVFEFFLWRNVFNLIAINAVVRVHKVDVREITKRQLLWIVLRAVVGNSCFVMINYSLTINSMSIQSILF
jgi:drug/metabolite transporter (DMT)-like permease